MKTLLVVVLLAAVAIAIATAAPHSVVRRSTAGSEAASSYFYFSRTPGSHVFPASAGGHFGGVPGLPETKAFFPVKVLQGVSEFGGDDFGKELSADSDEPDQHDAAYRVLELDEESSGGDSHESGHHALEKAHKEQGYDKKHAHDQAIRGSYGKEDHSHHYGLDGGRKKAHHDEASHYHDHHEEAKRTKGGKHHEKKHHKKGSKTTGYHNVFHKDEYKKEHVFYDTSDHTGQFKKYGSEHAHHSDDSGKKAAGGHEDRGHHETSYRKDGSKDQGKYDAQHAQTLHKHGLEQYDRTGSHYDHKHGHAGAGEGGYQIYHH